MILQGCCGDLLYGRGKYIPLAVPDLRIPTSNRGPASDTYVIGVVQYLTSFSSDLPITLVRGYVQIDTAECGGSQHFPLVNEMLNGTTQDVILNGSPVLAVTPPQYLGPIIAAAKDRPVRIVFHNFLPTGVGGNLFLPVDTTIMGSGMGPVDMPAGMVDGTVMDKAHNPMCGELSNAKENCFLENRATSTSTAASRRGSATGLRTNGSPLPTKARRGRRA